MSAEPHSLTREQAASLLVVVRANAEGRVVPAAELWDLPALGPAIVVLSRLAGQVAAEAPPVPPRRRVTRDEVSAVLSDQPQTTAAIAAHLGLLPDQIGCHLTRLRRDGRAVNAGRGWWAATAGEGGRAVGGAPTATPEARSAGQAPAMRSNGLHPATVTRRPTTHLDERDERLLDHLQRTGPLRVASLAWAIGMRTGEVTKRLRRLCYTGHVSEQDGYWRAEA